MSGPRDAAVRALGGVIEGGGYSDTILDILLTRDRKLTPEDRSLATEITYGVLRNLGMIDWVLARFSKRSVGSMDAEVRNILRASAYQILFLDKIPPYAVVDEAVKLTAVLGRRSAGSFVNGLLRTMLRGAGEIHYPTEQSDPEGFLTICCSLPPWLARFLMNRFGTGRALVIGRRYLERAPVVLRANNLLVTREELVRLLVGLGYDVEETVRSRFGIVVRGGGALFRTDLYRRGAFSLQDEASQLACLVLDPRPGMRVLDVCAAPGIKGTFCAELSGDRTRIVSIEINPARSQLIAENATRLGVRGLKTIAADIKKSPLAPSAAFDRVLVDPPCSGLGVVRRSPEIKWRLDPRDISTLAEGQQKILDVASAYVGPGGALVYAVCTINPDEGRGVIERFLKDHPDFSIDDVTQFLEPSSRRLIEDGALITSPDRFDDNDRDIPDGFYIARLTKR